MAQRELTPFVRSGSYCAWHDAIAIAALLDLVGLPNTTGNARRISKPCSRWDTFRQVASVPARRLARHRNPRWRALFEIRAPKNRAKTPWFCRSASG
jgi:hypothetical protein